jgi:hypothetical protein
MREASHVASAWMTAVGTGDVSVLRGDADRKTVHAVKARKVRMCSA